MLDVFIQNVGPSLKDPAQALAVIRDQEGFDTRNALREFFLEHKDVFFQLPIPKSSLFAIAKQLKAPTPATPASTTTTTTTVQQQQPFQQVEPATPISPQEAATTLEKKDTSPDTSPPSTAPAPATTLPPQNQQLPTHKKSGTRRVVTPSFIIPHTASQDGYPLRFVFDPMFKDRICTVKIFENKLLGRAQNEVYLGELKVQDFPETFNCAVKKIKVIFMFINFCRTRIPVSYRTKSIDCSNSSRSIHP